MVDERLDDERLAAVLASVGEHLVVDAPASAATVGSAGRTWRRPLLAAAAVLARRCRHGRWPSPRHGGPSADGSAPGASRSRSTGVAVPTGLPSFADPTERIDPAAADEVLGRPMPGWTRAAGPAERVVVPARGRRARRLADGETLWMSPATMATSWSKKVAGGADVLIELRDLGDGGVAITGEHLLQTPHRRVAADNVVAWTDGELTFRLDGERHSTT